MWKVSCFALINARKISLFRCLPTNKRVRCKTNSRRTFLSRSKSERKREQRNAFRSHIHRVSSSIDRHWLACLPAQSAKRRVLTKIGSCATLTFDRQIFSRPWWIAVTDAIATRRIYRFIIVVKLIVSFLAICISR